MIVADTSVWIAYFNKVDSRETALLDACLAREPILMGDLIYVEVLQGFRSDADLRRTRTALDVLEFQPMVGRDIAAAGIRNYRNLRAAGVTPRGTIDVLIATFCVENGHALLHADRDFDAMAKPLGLEVL